MGSSSSRPATEKLSRKQRRLLEAAGPETSLFSLGGRCVEGKVLDVHDGDTMMIAMVINGQLSKYSCRLVGIDAPELRPLKSTPGREKIIESAEQSRDYLRSLLSDDQMVTVKISEEKEKYGRLLVVVYSRTQEIDLNTMMINGGYAQPYSGGKKDAENGL